MIAGDFDFLVARAARSGGARRSWFRGSTAAGLLALTTAWLPLAAAESAVDAAAEVSEATEEAREFIRFIEREDGSGALQTANARMVREEDGAVVDLLSVVHIGDADYYQRFNEAFPDYDSVLFELVGDPGDLVRASARAQADAAAAAAGEGAEGAAEPRRSSGSMLGSMQAAAGRALELAYQLEVVDYTGDNLVHADMDGATFRQRQRDRNEGFLQLYLRAVRMSMANPQAATTSFGLLDVAEAFVANDRANRLKWLMAGELGGAEDLFKLLEDDGGTVIIGERNQVAMDVLVARLEEGDRKIGIFYGAGHMDDFERRLKELGFRTEGLDWWTAWELAPKAALRAAAPEDVGTGAGADAGADEGGAADGTDAAGR